MNIETTTLLTVFVPIIGSLTIPLAGLISGKARSAWALLLGGFTAFLPMTLIPTALGGGETILRKEFVLGLDFILVIDPLSIFMSIVSSFVGFLIILYSLGYIRREENQNEYYLMVVLFIGSMMGLVFSANLIFLYLFWEIIAICCWRLIGFYRLKEFVKKADKAFLVTFFGAVVMLLGFIQIYRTDRDVRPHGDARNDHPGERRAAHPVRDVLQVGDGAAAHVAARRRRGPDHRSRPCSTRRCWSRSASTPTPGSSSTASACPAPGPTRSPSSSWCPA